MAWWLTSLDVEDSPAIRTTFPPLSPFLALRPMAMGRRAKKGDNGGKVVRIAGESSTSSEVSHHAISMPGDWQHGAAVRRARSLSRSPEKGGDAQHSLDHCSHQFTCSQCGEAAQQNLPPSILRRSRESAYAQRMGVPYPYKKSATFDDMFLD